MGRVFEPASMKSDNVRCFACCMCPADENFNSGVCEDCNFKVAWQDPRGWVYFVRAGIGGTFKGFYAKSIEDYKNNTRQHGIRALEYKKTFMEAQEDLNWLGKKKKWTVYKESTNA